MNIRSQIDRIKTVLKNKKSFFNKFIFPLEFILSLLIVCNLFQFFMIKNYAGYHSLKHMIWISLLGLLILSLIIWNCIHNKGKIEGIVIGFLIPIGMMYTIFMIPSQVPDEHVHLMRAYEVSEGILIGRKDSISTIPRDLQMKIKPHMETYQQMMDNLKGNTDYNDKVEAGDPAITYPFILYLFSALGFIIARIFSLNIVIGFYLAKLMNFIVFLVAVYYVLKILPFGKIPMTAVVFMPMFLHQQTSTSADCLVNVICMLFIAFLLHLFFKEDKITIKEGVFLVILGVLMSISKYVYLPIVGISLILIASKKMSKKYKLILLVTLFILSTIAAGGYYIFSNSYDTVFTEYFTQNNVNSSEQIKGIIANPIGYLNTFISTLKTMGVIYIYQMVGMSLGWLCIGVNEFWISCYLFVMIACCFLENNKCSFNKKQKFLSVIISIGITALIITGMYITWTGVGKGLIEGVQGRYFIPVLYIVLLCLCQKENYVKVKNVEYILPILLCLLNLPELIAIYHAFMI